MAVITRLKCAGAVLFWSLLGPAIVSAQTVLYVDSDATGPQEDGAAWCTAFTELQSALDVAIPDTVIRVAGGAYRPDWSGLADIRTAAFALVDGVALEGGYAGCGAPDPDERDLAGHETVLSGDLFENDMSLSWLDEFAACYTGGAVSVTPECAGYDFNFNNSVDGLDLTTLLSVMNYDENSYHVVTSSGNASSASLDGLTIRGGNADGAGAGQESGAGMYVVVGAPTVSRCSFRYNVAVNGGGMYNDLNAGTLVTDSTFSGNLGISGTSSGVGGAVVNFNGQPAFRRCLFIGNAAASGGAVFGQNSSVTLERSMFLDNRALNGGGLYASSSNTNLIDTLFTGNTAHVQGGGLRFLGGGPTMINATVAQNAALAGGGIATASSTLTIDNTILWANNDGGSSAEAAQLDVTTGTVTVARSCIQGLNQFSGNDNIGLDPVFVNPAGDDTTPGTLDDDLRLSPGSPCADSGDNGLVTTSVDLDGNPRILDGDGDEIPTVDMGAYELDFEPPPDCFGIRDLSQPQLNFEPGVTKTVRIELLPNAETTAIGVEDIPPQGWTDIANISNGGSYDAVAHKVKWGPLFSPFPAELTYDITPPVTADGEACFDGITSINGDRNEVTCGDTCIEVRPCPFLPADDTQEACLGCADCTCDVCQDGQIVLCEMVGYACAWKSGCNDDIAAMTRAAFLWQSGELFCWDSTVQTWIPEAGSASNPACCEPGQAFSAPTIAGGLHVSRGWAVLRLSSHRSSHDHKVVEGNVVIRAPEGTVAVGLEVFVPRGWSVSDISDDGTWDALNRKVKWGPFFESLSRTVSFSLTGKSAKVWASDFSGTVSFDGYNEPVIVQSARIR